MIQALFDILKLVAGLAVIVGVSFYWLNRGLPPRGRGRWHQVLSEHQERQRER